MVEWLVVAPRTELTPSLTVGQIAVGKEVKLVFVWVYKSTADHLLSWNHHVVRIAIPVMNKRGYFRWQNYCNLNVIGIVPRLSVRNISQ